jgi:PKD repeat protein
MDRRPPVFILTVVLAATLVAAPVVADDEFEPNDELEEAPQISPGRYENLTLHENGSDHYAVSLEAGETLNVTATFSEAGEDVVQPGLTLFDGEGEVLEFAGSRRPTEDGDAVDYRLTWEAAGGQTVYLRVGSDSSGSTANRSADYDLSVNHGRNDKFEPNGRLDRAARTVPATYDDLTLLSEESDYYSMSLAAGESLNVTATFSETGERTVEPELTLLDSDGEVLEFAASRQPTAGSDVVDYRLTWEATGGQTVYLRVASDPSGSTDDFSASYDLTVRRGENDRLEPNGVRGQARVIAPGTYDDLTLLSEESDYYSMSLAAGESLNVTATFSETGERTVEPELTLLDSDGEVLEFAASRQPTAGSDVVDYRLTWEATGGQTVYLRVASDPSGSTDDFSASYDLTVRRGENDRFEPNGVRSQARVIAPGTYDGLTLLGEETDLYAVSLVAGETLDVTATFSQAGEDAVEPELTLLDSDGEIVDLSASRRTTGPGGTIDHRLAWETEEPRTVYLGVRSAPSGPTDDLVAGYELDVADTVAPTPDAGSDRTVGLGETVTFDAGNSTDNGEIAGYEWDFGNGDTATGETATRTYRNTGTHEVTLRVTDEADNVGIDTATVVVEDRTPPDAEAGPDRTVAVGETVSFNASATTDNDRIRRYEWDLADGDRKTGEVITHTYQSVGTYEVTLNVTDGGGNRDDDTVTVTVTDRTPPTADAGPNRTVAVDEPITLDASGSTDDGNITTYEWDAGNGSVLTGREVTVQYADPGTYEVSLTATDQSGNEDMDTATVNVTDETPPAADAGENRAVEAGDPVTLNASASTDNGMITSYEWADGNGSVGTGEQVTVVYDSPGTYELTLTVVDQSGNEDTDTVTVAVTRPDTAGNGTDENGGGSSQPLSGVGIGAAVVGLVGAGYVLRRRGR